MISSTMAPEPGPLGKPLYGRAILACIGILLIATTARFSGFALRAEQTTTATDFHAFYAAAQMVWRGTIGHAYHFPDMLQSLQALTGSDNFLPWSYPPQYNLVMAPLALLPMGAAYFAFTAVTLGAYLVILQRLSGPNFTFVLLAIFPALVITVACGQNGFLTGALVGLACMGLLHCRASAGLPLGLMTIKPHLVVGLALHTILTRRWKTVVVAALTVAVTTAGATALLGLSIWSAFLGGLKETRIFLEAGFYPLFRMISPYAAIRSLGAPAATALACHAVIAVLGLVLIGLAAYRFRAPSQQIGFAVLCGLLVSPYAYDYDLPIFGIGLALLLPELLRLATQREQAAIFGLSFFTSAWGLAKSTALDAQPGPEQPFSENVPASLAGIALVILILLIWRVLRRDHAHRELTSSRQPFINRAAESYDAVGFNRCL